MRRTTTDLKEMIRAGKGDIPADLVIKNGNLINVSSEEIYPADVAIYKDKIVAIGNVEDYIGPDTTLLDVDGKYIAPGLIDGHIHSECSKMSITSFAKAVVPAGTTSMISGLDEYLVTSGLEGLREVLDEMKQSPLKVFWGAPFKTPYTFPTSTVGFNVTKEVHKEVQTWPECYGVWETVREFIQEEDEDALGAIEVADTNRLPVFGCAPMARGKDLNSYLCAGVRLDHESYDHEEVVEKIRNGMYMLIRESSVTHFLDENMRAVTEVNPHMARRISFCTDDVTASDVLTKGHVDNLVRMTIKKGVPPIKAIQMGSINSAEAYRIDHLVGSVSPGKVADVLIVDSPESFNVLKVISKGELVAENGKMIKKITPPPRSKALTDTMNVAPVSADDFALKTDYTTPKVNVLSMSVTVDSPFERKRRDVVLKVENGVVMPDTEQDALYVTVVERYGKTNNKPIGFCSGWKLKSGAMASSAAPDDNNIVCIGTNKDDMAIAVNCIIETGGGQVVVDNGEIVEFLPLPIGGIVSDIEPAEMAEKEKKLDDAARALGCDLPEPFMYMFFLPITAIPDYAMTDIGTIDCISLQKIDPVLGGVNNDD